MREQLIEYIATAPEGECWPRLAGVSVDAHLEIVSIERFADQIRMRYRPRVIEVWIARGLAGR